MPGMNPTDGLKGIGCAIHEVGPTTAVDVKIDESGSQVAALEVDGFSTRLWRIRSWPHKSDALIVRLHNAGIEEPIAENDGAVMEVQHLLKTEIVNIE